MSWCLLGLLGVREYQAIQDLPLVQQSPALSTQVYQPFQLHQASHQVFHPPLGLHKFLCYQDDQVDQSCQDSPSCLACQVYQDYRQSLALQQPLEALALPSDQRLQDNLYFQHRQVLVHRQCQVYQQYQDYPRYQGGL